MKEWMVQLNGDKWDLNELPKELYSSECSVVEEHGSYYLKSSDFNCLKQPGEVLQAATLLMEHANGVAKLRLSGFHNVAVSHRVIGIDDEGERQLFVLVTDSWEFRDKITVTHGDTKADGSVKPPKESTQAKSYIELVKRDKNVADALRFFTDVNWVNLYKVWEIVADDLGNQRKIYKNNWATKGDLNRFTQTAQSRHELGDQARHAHSKFLPPADPMLLTEAESLMRIILRKWVDQKLLPISE